MKFHRFDQIMCKITDEREIQRIIHLRLTDVRFTKIEGVDLKIT